MANRFHRGRPAPAAAVRLTSRGPAVRSESMENRDAALHHVQITIPPDREDMAREFYCETVGFREVGKPASLAEQGGLWLSAGSGELHIGIDERFLPGSRAHVAFLVSDLEGLASRLAAGMYELYWDNALPGFRRFFVTDPFGNRLEFLTPAA